MLRSLAIVAALTVGLAGQAAAQGLDELDILRIQYADLHSAHLRASAIIRVSPPGMARGPDVQGTGSFEWWADGEKYRVNCRTDRGLGLAQDYDIAFDGDWYQFYDHAAQVVSLQKGDVDQLPTGLPNPLFLPLDFLSKNGDSALKLRDVVDPGLWRARTQKAAVSADGKGIEIAGDSLTFRISTGDGNRRRIERRGPDGAILGIVEFALPDTELGEWPYAPRRIVLKSLKADGSTGISADYTVEIAEINVPIPPDIFRIEPGDAAVWDSDEKAFVKMKAKKPVERKQKDNP